MKKVLLTLFSLSFLSMAYSQTYVNEHFNQVTPTSLPLGWSSTSSNAWKIGSPDDVVPYVSAIGISINHPKHKSIVGIDGVVTADGAILSTPSFSLPPSTTNIKLVFDLSYFQVRLNADTSKKETLYLVASIDDGASWSELQSIDAITSNDFWETRSIDISAYAGETNLKFGFKYQNSATRLVGAAFDNIRVYIESPEDIALSYVNPEEGSSQSYKVNGSSGTISGFVFNYGTDPISSYTINYKHGSNPIESHTVTNANIAPLTGESFSHSTPFTIPSIDQFQIDVWVEMSGDAFNEDDSAKAYFEGTEFMPEKRLVFEEGTGTWCPWCPRGTVKMEEFAEQMEGMAAQIAVHNSDPMAVAAYDAFLLTHISGFPSILVDRDFVDDPGEIMNLYNENKDNFGYAELTLGTLDISGNSIDLPVTLTPSIEISNAKLAFVITESNVTGQGRGWGQVNAYAGGQYGPMGGYETQPGTVEGINYHFVARTISPSPLGDAAGLPSVMNAGSDYTVTLSATIDPNWKQEDLQYIVLLLGEDGKVLNSNFTELPFLAPGLPSNITNIEAGIEKAYIYPNPTAGSTNLTVKAKESDVASILITDAIGRTVSESIDWSLKAGNNTINIPTMNLTNGVYFINMNTSKGKLVFKLQVIK